MKIFATISLSVIVGAGVLLTAPQQNNSLSISLPNDIRMDFVRISPGEFMMGCSPGDTQCADDEKPAHRVRITRGFEMAKYEVTEAQWQAVTVASPFVPIPGSGDNHAMGATGWSSAQEFLDRLNARKDGFKYRFPTEAEWEYAARAGTTGPHSGPSLPALGWFGQNVFARPEIVGQKQPNAWGLYDMHGNVWEWVEDFYDSRYYASSPSSDPKGPAQGQYRVLRGGSSLADAKSLRVSKRHFIGIPLNSDYYGFRPVRELTTAR